MPLKKLLLVDGNNLFATSFHANSAKVVDIFFNRLWRAYHGQGCNCLAVCFDGNGPTFRHRLYPAYKAQRKPKPDGYEDQLVLVYEMVR